MKKLMLIIVGIIVYTIVVLSILYCIIINNIKIVNVTEEEIVVEIFGNCYNYQYEN